MLPICDDALNEWKSLYTEEMQNVWSTEKKELRRVAMVFYVLKQEFARIESNLTREMSNFREKVDIIDNFKKSNSSTSPVQCTEKALETQLQNTEETPLNKSPKLNKCRRPHLKMPLKSLSLFKIQNKSGSSITVPKLYDKPESEELFDSSVCDSSLDRDVFEDSSANNKSYVFKTPQGIKRLANGVVDSSFLVEDTPNKYTDKKFKWTRKHSNKTANDKRKKSYTPKQMFDNFPSQKTKLNSASSNKSRNTKRAITIQSKLKDSNFDDETFFGIDQKIPVDITNKNVQLKENIPISSTFFKDYDKIPEVRKPSLQHVHKTETVRRKVDRMKLPGWSCSDCEQYYRDLNLPAEELRKKMNMCSKHRNKFPLLDTTRKGFWDVDMPPTQEDQQNDTSLLNF